MCVTQPQMTNVSPEFLIQQVWGGSQEFPFIKTSLRTLMLLVQRLCFENHWPASQTTAVCPPRSLHTPSEPLGSMFHTAASEFLRTQVIILLPERLEAAPQCSKRKMQILTMARKEHVLLGQPLKPPAHFPSSAQNHPSPKLTSDPSLDEPILAFQQSLF